MANGEEQIDDFAGRTLPSLFWEGLRGLYSTMGSGASQAISDRSRLVVDEQGQIRLVESDHPLHPSWDYTPTEIAPVSLERAIAALHEAQGTTPRAPASTFDLSGLVAGLDGGSTGFRPSLVDTRSAESLLRFEETPEERAALEQLLQDLEFRAEAGTEAVRSGWAQVQAINSAAALRAEELARQAGPEAARLWIDAANNVLNLSSQAAQVLGSTAGMQRVNISPTAGSETIAALLAAEAPRAQQLAQRMGMASAEQIAAQSRTAAMMGEAYAGDIQRIMLIQANQARMAHNQRVFERTSQERQLGAQMRFQAATTNAQLLSQAAAQAAAGGTTEERRRALMRNLIADVREFANIDPMGETPRTAISALMQIYSLDEPTARSLIEGARQGTLDWASAMAAAEG